MRAQTKTNNDNVIVSRDFWIDYEVDETSNDFANSFDVADWLEINFINRATTPIDCNL